MKHTIICRYRKESKASSNGRSLPFPNDPLIRDEPNIGQGSIEFSVLF